MTESYPAQPTTAAVPEKPKKKRRIFLWVFLAVQVLFIIWIIAGLSGASGDAADCGSLSQADCNAAEDIGTGIGVALVVGFWLAVDFLMAVTYGVYRLASRR